MYERAINPQEPPRKRFRSPSIRVAGLFILSLLSVLHVVAPLQAQSIATVRPSPAQLELMQGETAALEINLENARDLYGIDVRLSFDPALLEILDTDPNQSGVQMVPGAFPKPELIALNAADNASGTARYVITQLNPTPPATGSGVVLTVQVRALASGRTELAIPLVEMSDRDGNLLAVNTGSSIIEVRGNPAAATGIPIQPPGAAAGASPASTATDPAATAPATADVPTTAAPAATNPPPGQPTPIATAVAEQAAAGDPALPSQPTAAAEAPAAGAAASESEIVATGESSDIAAGETSSEPAPQTGIIPAGESGESQQENAAAPAAVAVIGESSEAASSGAAEVPVATRERGLPTGAIIVAVMAAVIAGFLLLARLNRRV